MRITHKHEYKNLLANRRIAYIQKAQRKTHKRLQLVNNRLVDKLVLEYNLEYSPDIYNPYDEDTIRNELLQYNLAASQADLRRILQHSVVTRNPQSEMEAHKVIRSVGDSLSKLEAERVVKNLNYVADVIDATNVDIEKYKTLIEKLPPQVSRKKVLERCIVDGEELPASKRQRWLERNLARGESYNKKYTYKELNQLSRDLERYKTNRMDYEVGRLENIQADREGYDRVNVTKTWVWSQLERTRHEDLDGETVDFAEKFEVVNSQNGDTDYLRFPGDIDGDNHNCSNICNCQCSYEINKG